MIEINNVKSDLSITEILEGRSRPINHERQPETVDADTVASWLGLTPRRVIGLAKEGAIPTVGRGRYDLRSAVAAYCDTLRRSAAGRGTVDKEYRDEKTRLAKEQADKISVSNALARRDLLPADEVELEWTGVLRDVRARLMAVPSRVGSRVPTMTAHDVREVEREIRDALAELADG